MIFMFLALVPREGPYNLTRFKSVRQLDWRAKQCRKYAHGREGERGPRLSTAAALSCLTKAL